MKNSVEKAYYYTMKIVEKIKDQGIKTKIKKTKPHKETIEKYHPPDRLHYKKWLHVSFYPKTKDHSNLIYEEATKLRELGIHFDTGAGFGARDWDIDWSFYCDIDNTDTESLEILEDIIKEMNFNKALL